MSHTYPTSLYQTIASVEDDHFWFVSRSRMIASFIRQHIKAPYTSLTFLEIGCGTGIVMEMLEKLGFETTGLDVNKKAISFALKRTRGKLVRTSIFGYTNTTRYNVVGAFDVLEHIRDDAKFLSACHRLLQSKGYLFLTVPAGMGLWSQVDTQSGHVRRYEYEELLTKLKTAGFRVTSIKYWNGLLLPLYKVWHQKKGVGNNDAVFSHMRPMPFVINTLLKWLFLLELLLSRFIRLKSGATLVVCAEKRNE